MKAEQSKIEYIIMNKPSKIPNISTMDEAELLNSITLWEIYYLYKYGKFWKLKLKLGLIKEV